MNKQKTYWLAGTILAVIILGGIFYWYSYRPTAIRKKCYSISSGNLNRTAVYFNSNSYQNCLRKNGLEK